MFRELKEVDRHFKTMTQKLKDGLVHLDPTNRQYWSQKTKNLFSRMLRLGE